jgi:hypothetical protein
MNPANRAHFSLCGHCGRPLRQALPCPLCGRSCCRWRCYTEHVDRHRGAGEDGNGPTSFAGPGRGRRATESVN